MRDIEIIDAGPALVVGAGLAGLFAALKFQVRPVTILAGSPIGSGASSFWAQGGIAAAMGVACLVQPWCLPRHGRSHTAAPDLCKRRPAGVSQRVEPRGHPFRTCPPAIAGGRRP